MRSAAAAGAAAGGVSLARLRRSLVPYSFILPSFLFLLAFTFWPLARALWLSLTRWSMIGPAPRFVGGDNYRRLLEDPQFRTAVANTVYYTVGSVPTGIVLGLALALLMNQPLRGRGLLRSAYFFPTVTSTVAVSLVWLYMFDVHLGVVNYLLQLVGLPPQKWLHDPLMAMPAVVLYGLWHGVGYTMMIFLAGLQAIPNDLYEAAMVDGAGRGAAFRHVTLPLLKPVTLFVLITSVIGSFKVFDAVYVMTRGGPSYATMPVVQYIYMTAFEAFEMGYASAIAVVLFAIVLVLTVVQLRAFGGEAEA